MKIFAQAKINQAYSLFTFTFRTDVQLTIFPQKQFKVADF